MFFNNEFVQLMTWIDYRNANELSINSVYVRDQNNLFTIKTHFVQIKFEY